MHVAIVSVDVGNVIVRPQGEPRQTLEVDFVANKGGNATMSSRHTRCYQMKK